MGPEQSVDTDGKIGVMQLYWFTAGGGLSFHTASQPEESHAGRAY